MNDFYLRHIHIDKVRHLENIDIQISDAERKHLILTGKNGSGKTSLLKALSRQMDYLTTQGDFEEIKRWLNYYRKQVDDGEANGRPENEAAKNVQLLKNQHEDLENATAGLELTFNISKDGIKAHFEQGDFIVAYYEATRKFDAVIPKHVEKINLKDNYGISESPRNEFVKYILDLKMTEALAQTSGKKARADEIHAWFDNFEKLLRDIFEDDSVKLLFDEETFTFSIHQDGRENFDFQGLSDGFAAVLDIVVDIMVRMEKHLGGKLNFDLPGIVLIDEIETHLHLELQRHVLVFLTNVFPNIQFIISTHSPFILSSAQNATIFDLETKTLVENGLSGLPYDGIVRGYFEVDDLSKELRDKYERYKALVAKERLTDDDFEEISELEMYLDEIPDYLAIEISSEYRRMKADFENRGDL